MKSIFSLFSLLPLLFCPAFSQIQNMSDEFDDAASLSNWSNTSLTEGWNAEHLEVLDVNTTQSGRLVMIPYTTGWFEDRRAPLIYKEINGDFIVTTEVHVSNRAGNGIPSSTYSLAGPMLRTPRHFPNGALNDWTPGNENYVFLSAGYGDETGPGQPGTPPHLEVKTTVNSNSNLHITAINSQIVTIRIARIGNACIMLYREPGAAWNVHRRYDRPDFPDTLQAGMMAYTDWPKVSSFSPFYQNSHVLTAASADPDSSSHPNRPFNPDLEAGFEYFRFDSVQVPQALQGVDLVNTATDAELLSFLGFTSTPLTHTDPIEFPIRIFPNPSADQVELSLPPAFNGYWVLRNIQGQQLLQAATTERTLNLRPFPAGLYLLEVHGSNGQILAREKVIKR